MLIMLVCKYTVMAHLIGALDLALPYSADYP